MIRIRRILVPTDFSDCSVPAVRYGAELAEKFGAELVLLHVVPDAVLALPDAVMPTPVPAADLDVLTDSGRQGLANLIATEKLEPITDWIKVVSAVSREAISPERFSSKKAGLNVMTWL